MKIIRKISIATIGLVALISTNGVAQSPSISWAMKLSNIDAVLPVNDTTTIGKLSMRGLIQAYSTMSESFVAPTQQGAWLGWNRDGGSGLTGFANQQGLGAGGFEWLFYNSGDSLYLEPMKLTSAVVSVPHHATDTVGKLDLHGLVRTYSTLSRTFISPNEQGAWFGWNRDGGSGFTGFANHKGQGPGGFEWLFYGRNDSLDLVPMTLTNTVVNVPHNATDSVAKLNLHGLTRAYSTQSTTFISPTEQGAWFGWNRDGGSGLTGFANHRGTGPGGFEWLLYNQTDSLTSTPMTIDGSGNVGIGTQSPSTTLEVAGQIKITGGNPAQGSVLTSDANGKASWQPVPVPSGSGSGSGSNPNAYPVDVMQPYMGINFIICTDGIYPSRSLVESNREGENAADDVGAFLGEIKMFAGNYAPRGWAFCAGQTLSISQNMALYSLLGTYYGGDGRTTFALPDLRGRVPVGTGTAPGLSNRRLGEIGGHEQVNIRYR